MATDEKPPCGCGHPFAEHDEVELSQLSTHPSVVEKQYVCYHVDRGKGATLGTVCGCSNYRPPMTPEQKFKNVVFEAVLSNLPARSLVEDEIMVLVQQSVDIAWKKFSE